MSDLNLEEIEARAAAATPGPWEMGTAGNCNVVHFDGDDIRAVALAVGDGNHEFIAHARVDVPALCALVRELEELVEYHVSEEHHAKLNEAGAAEQRDQAIAERDAMRQRLLPEDERHVLNDRDACVHCGQLCIVGERCPARTECFRRAVADAREQALEQALFDAEVELKRLASIAWDAGQGLAEDGDDDAAECEEERAMGIESGINAIRALKSSERP